MKIYEAVEDVNAVPPIGYSFENATIKDPKIIFGNFFNPFVEMRELVHVLRIVLSKGWEW